MAERLSQASERRKAQIAEENARDGKRSFTVRR